MAVVVVLLALVSAQATPRLWHRRQVVSQGFFAGAVAWQARAHASEPEQVVARGTVTLQPGVDPPTGGALYVTARPDRADHLPAEAAGGKSPPVASARFAGPLTFPFTFELTTADLTPEGLASQWWAGEALVVSSRLDEDGVAATRGPNDLVGRATSVVRRPGADAAGSVRDDVLVELRGRGFGGKLVTRQSGAPSR